jgi:hypothetical protein
MRKYLPEEYNRRVESAMTPSELGKKWGSELMDRFLDEMK